MTTEEKQPKSEYPKELFVGDKVSYSCRIIHNEKEEIQFREMWLVDYSELPEYVEQEEVLESE